MTSNILTLNLKPGTVVIAVEVPEDADKIELHAPDPFKVDFYLTYHTGMGTDDYDILRETLPYGFLEEIGLLKHLTEEQAAELVKIYKLPLLIIYKNYSPYSADACDTALESLNSSITAAGGDVNKNYYLLRKI
ncbi:MAG: hypothetical protein JST87_05350 [Bacteroidetes bacterium]|nr:hypothetical protein [Bacteroidota bacterium]